MACSFLPEGESTGPNAALARSHATPSLSLSLPVPAGVADSVLPPFPGLWWSQVRSKPLKPFCTNASEMLLSGFVGDHGDRWRRNGGR